MEYLRELLEKNNITGTIAEIGSFDGQGSTDILLEYALAHNSDFFAIDTFPDAALHDQVRRKLSLPNTHAIQGYSVDIGRSWQKPLEFLFIDGDHGFPHITPNGSHSGVVLDILSWHPHVAIGGILAFHDYTGSDTHYGEGSLVAVEAAVDSLCFPPAYEYIGRQGQIVAFRKLRDMVLYPRCRLKKPAADYAPAWGRLNAIAAGIEHIVIYGTGGGAKYVYDAIITNWPAACLPAITFTDSFTISQKLLWDGRPLVPFAEVVDTPALFVVGSLHEKEIMQILERHGKKNLHNAFLHFEFISWCHIGRCCA